MSQCWHVGYGIKLVLFHKHDDTPRPVISPWFTPLPQIYIIRTYASIDLPSIKWIRSMFLVPCHCFALSYTGIIIIHQLTRGRSISVIMLGLKLSCAWMFQPRVFVFFLESSHPITACRLPMWPEGGVPNTHSNSVCGGCSRSNGYPKTFQPNFDLGSRVKSV